MTGFILDSDTGDSGPMSWASYRTEPGGVRCAECGVDYVLQPGEPMNFSDPRLADCVHSR